MNYSEITNVNIFIVYFPTVSPHSFFFFFHLLCNPQKKKPILFCKQFSLRNMSWTFSHLIQYEKTICYNVDFPLMATTQAFYSVPHRRTFWFFLIVMVMCHPCVECPCRASWLYSSCSAECFKVFDQSALQKG